MKQKKLRGLEKLAEINRQLQAKKGPYYNKWLREILRGVKKEKGGEKDGREAC
jgi:hypothetical protein